MINRIKSQSTTECLKKIPEQPPLSICWKLKEAYFSTKHALAIVFLKPCSLTPLDPTDGGAPGVEGAVVPLSVRHLVEPEDGRPQAGEGGEAPLGEHGPAAQKVVAQL